MTRQRLSSVVRTAAAVIAVVSLVTAGVLVAEGGNPLYVRNVGFLSVTTLAVTAIACAAAVLFVTLLTRHS
jgi:hypothetical protein